MKRRALGLPAVVVAIVFSVPAFAQEAKSAALAKQLAAALDAAKLDSIAAKDPANAGVYLGALYQPGVQLLTISAKYSVPQLLDARLAKKEFRDTYLDLNGAGTAKVFIDDVGIDGLKAKPADNQGADTYEAAGKRVLFDNDPKKQKLSDEEYAKAYAEADEQYARMLMALLAQLKKPS